MRECALFRLSQLAPESQGLTLTSAQQEVREAVSHTWETATSLTTALPLLAGGFSSRLAQGAVLSASTRSAALSNGILKSFARPAAWTASLFTEVTAFETASRGLEEIEGKTENLQRWQWQGQRGLKTALFTAGINFTALRGGGFAARGENVVFRHVVQSMAMVGGNNVAGVLNVIPIPDQPLSAQFFHAETTNIQIGATMAALHTTAPWIHAWERSLDLNRRVGAKPSDFPSENQMALPLRTAWDSMVPELATGRIKKAPSPSQSLLEETLHSKMSSLEEGGLPTKETAQRLAREYRVRFPLLKRSDLRSESIIRSVLEETPCAQADFHERLLEALTKASNRGHIEQFYTVLAIQDLFKYSDLNSPTGSFQNVVHQVLLRRIMADPEAGRRQAAALQLFQAMERGLKSADLMAIFQQYGYGQDLKPSPKALYPEPFGEAHRKEMENYWNGFTEEDRRNLLNAVYQLSGNDEAIATQLILQVGRARTSGFYKPQSIDEVVRHARSHPFGDLMLKRMIQAVRADDTQAKLTEMLPDSPGGFIDETVKESFIKGTARNLLKRIGAYDWLSRFRQRIPSEKLSFETLEYIHYLSQRGFGVDTVAKMINGTRHTAYFEDLRLARKVVLISKEIYPFVKDAPEKLSDRRNELERLCLSYLGEIKPADPMTEKHQKKPTLKKPTVDEYLEMIEKLTGKSMEGVQEDRKKGKLNIKILSKDEFDTSKYAKGLSLDVEQRARTILSSDGRRVEIQLVELPDYSLKTDNEKYTIYKVLRQRLYHFAHEIGHYKVMTGQDESIAAYPEGAIPKMSDRPSVLISEIMANLDELPLRNRYQDLEPWIIPHRLGENFQLYLRTLNEFSHYGRTNQWLMKGVQPIVADLGKASQTPSVDAQ